MAFLDENILNEWDENIGFAAGAESCTGIEVIEIAVYPDEPPVISRHFHGPAQIRGWATETETTESTTGPGRQPNTSPPCGSLLLVLAGYGYQQTALRGEDMTEFPLPNGAQPWCFPFSREDYDLIRLKLRLPRATSMMFSKIAWYNFTPSYFQVDSVAARPSEHIDQNEPGSDRIGITMKFPGSDLVRMDASVSISHSITDKSTKALIVCRYGCQASYIATMITHLAGVATHPATIPTLMCSLYQTTLRRQVGSTWDVLFGVERASGQSGIPLIDASGRIQSPGNCDDPELSTNAIRATQLATAWDTYVPRANGLLSGVHSFLESYDKDHVKDKAGVLAKQSRILREFIILESQRADHLDSSVKHLLQRSKIQVEAINNYLAHTSNQINQRIALNTQMDSSSMKSIAILTMSFLPATFLATLFATPGVSSTQPSQGLYWAVTIPVTLCVFGIWAIWTFASMRKMQTIPSRRDSSARPHPTAQLEFPEVPGEFLRNSNLRSILPESDLPERSQLASYPWASNERIRAQSVQAG